jgi:hypothetical protein
MVEWPGNWGYKSFESSGHNKMETIDTSNVIANHDAVEKDKKTKRPGNLDFKTFLVYSRITIFSG